MKKPAKSKKAKLRVPDSLRVQIEAGAAKTGLSREEFINYKLREALGMPTNPPLLGDDQSKSSLHVEIAADVDAKLEAIKDTAGPSKNALIAAILRNAVDGIRVTGTVSEVKISPTGVVTRK